MGEYEKHCWALCERCKGCQYAKRIKTTDGLCFTGCKCPPYRGKWVMEIEECPKLVEKIEVGK